MEKLTRPAWMEIDLDNLIHNYKEIRSILKEKTELMAVVKADAYEHGAVQIVRTLMEEGVEKFGVAHLSEALHIRKYVKDAEILIMGYTPEYLAEKAILNDITLTVYLKEQGEIFSQLAKRLDRTVKIHVKIETGMNRLGFMPNEDGIKDIKDIYNMDNIEVEGMFTHFAASDDDPSYTMEQVRRFDYVCNTLQKLDINIPIKHISNSAAIMNFPDLNYDMVRAGIILYGVYPFPNADRELLKLKNILTLKAQISHVKEIGSGEKLSYGLIYEAKKKTKIATVPIGYADGFSRELSNKGNCIVNNTVVPIVGRICMDQLMIDVTGLDVKRGDEAILMGKSLDKEITIEEVANKSGQIPAAVQCMFNKRLPRIYIKNKEIINVTDYLLEL
ncbi:alanine racemase [Tissierella carlieri]|uniref:Alanine racemase n=1 Tax=Tissierella carlieri TaxID=689904 RepID=A0ABT1SGM5_9FIRM|nr:alanine racemase [Tissierella carlieri]MCQ4925630.1 alanine racemase [Tissierella carlieri]